MSNVIKIDGAAKLVSDMSIELEFISEKEFYLHLWEPTKDKLGREGKPFNHPVALRAYALGILDMAERFEEAARSEWESRGGTWVSAEELKSNGDAK